MLKKEIFLNYIIIVFAMAALFLLGNVTVVSALDESESDIASGIYDNVPWRITADYELLIGEEDQEYTFKKDTERNKDSYPWKEYAGQIKGVTVHGTVYGSGSFSMMFYALKECEFMDIEGLDTSEVTDVSWMFGNCDALSSLDLSVFDTGSATNMRGLFRNCDSLTSIDVSGFKTESVTDMSYMFAGLSLTSIDLSGLDTRSVTNMRSMFAGVPLTNIDLSGFNTGSVKCMSDMFSGCDSLRSIDVSGIDTGTVCYMDGMFRGCSSLTNIDISGFNTGNVTIMSEMFRDCRSLTEINLTGIDTGRVSDMFGMFTNCESLTRIDMSGFDMSSVTSMRHMFWGCKVLTQIDMSGVDTSNVTDTDGMFANCESLTSVDLSGFNTGNVKNMNYMFFNCKSLTRLDVSGFNTGNVKDMSEMFYECSSLTSIDVSGFDTGKVTDMINMFRGCRALTSIDLSGFDMSSVTDMHSMFEHCRSLISVDMSGADASKVTDVRYMFYNCSSLKNIDMSDFNAESLKTMREMFYGCSSLTSVNMSGMDIRNVTYMNNLFSSCSSLKNIDMSEIKTGSITDISYMFSLCRSLTRVNLSGLIVNDLCNMDGMFFGCESLKEVEISNLKNWCAIDFSTESSNPLNASPDAVLTINGGTGSRVTLEEGITTIPSRTFNGWKYLKEVSLPASLTKIGAGAFEGTSSLNTVNVDSLDQWLNMDFATESCNPLASGKAELRIRSGSEYGALSEVVIDRNVGRIPAYAFSGCLSLRSVVIPDGVTSIGTGAFASCEMLSQIVIPDSVSVLPEDLFRGCTELKKVLIPDSVIDIDLTAFNGHSKDLVLYGTPGSAAEVFANLQGIPFRDYSEYDAMQAGTITDDVRWILTGGSQLTIEGSGKDALPDYEAGTSPIAGIADKVTSIKIKGISDIGAGVFSGFTKLERVTIDINTQIKSISPKAFAGCSDVEVCCYHNSYDTVVQATSDFPGFTVKKLSGSRAGNVTWTFNEDTGTMLLTSGSAEFGETFTESPFKDLDVRRVEFSDSFVCNDLPANLFAGCTSLTEVQLAAQTTEIGEAAFKDCTNLRRVIWHDGVTTIGEGVFENCTNLQQVLLADSVLVNEYDQEMEDLSVEIPEGVKVIPANAFRNCSAIREVDWYEDAENEQGSGSIGASAFANCLGLAEIGIPDYVERIGESAFKGCTALSQQDGELAFSESLDVLGAQALYDCSQILTMNFEKDPSSIGEDALGTNIELIVEAPENASNLKAYCRNAGMTFIALEGMGDTETHQDAYVKLAKSSVTVKAGKSKKIAYSTNGKVKGIKASGTGGKVSVTKSGHKVKFKGKSAKSGFRVSLKFDMKNAKDVTKSVSVTVKKASSGLGVPEGEEQIIGASRNAVTFSSDAAASQKVRINRPEGAEGALVCTASKRGIVKYTMKDDGTLQLTPAKAGKTKLTIYAEADEVFDQSEPISITITVKARPANVTAKVKKLTKKKARVSWKKVSGVKSYQIQVSVKKNFKQKKTYTAKSSATKKIVKITKGKKNYVRVRYKLANGKAGKWSTTLVVKK